VTLLLDTHALLWWLADDARLGATARAAVAEPANAVYLSAGSVWKVRIKQAIGKLKLPDDFATVLDAQCFLELPVTVAHAHAVSELPMHHRDSFDRMLVAQASVEELVLVTADVAFDA
jgi:PIN domain nuclease of toxin-antitoxin system